MKKLSIKILFLLILINTLVFTSCGKAKPEKVALDFVNALFQKDFDTIMKNICKSKADSYTSAEEMNNFFLSELGDAIVLFDFIVKDTKALSSTSKIDGVNAIATVNIETIDIDNEDYAQAFTIALLSCIGMEDTNEIVNKITSQLEEYEVPLITKEININLVLEEGQWKVDI